MRFHARVVLSTTSLLEKVCAHLKISYSYWDLKDSNTGLEIATDRVTNATKTLNLATKNSTLVATLATMIL